MNIPSIRLPALHFRRLSKRGTILLAGTFIITIIAVAVFFVVLPKTGFAQDWRAGKPVMAFMTSHNGNVANVLATPLAQPLIADFTAVQVQRGDPINLRFIDLSRGSPAQWFWDFGDGTNATERNPSHMFGPDYHSNISLTVTREDGASSRIVRNNILLAVTQKPLKVLVDTNRIGTVMKGSSVSFQVNGTGDNVVMNGKRIPLWQGSVVKLRMNNENNGAIAIRNGNLAGFSCSDGTLFINGRQSASGAVGQISVKNPEWLSTDIRFMVKPVRGDIRRFIVDGSTIRAGQDNAWIQIFELDLNSGSDLTIETEPAYFEGDAIAFQFVPAVIADFDPGSNLKGEVPFEVRFTDQSAGSPASWLWNFGDGTTSREKNPAHTYTKQGSYTVKLTAQNGEITDIKEKERLIIVTLPKVVANFSATPVSGTSPLTVKFTDQSLGSPTSWLWDFGDGTNATEQNPVHTYTEKGVFSVGFAAGNIFGSNEVYREKYITVTDPFPDPENSVFLKAGRGGYIETGSTFQFVITGLKGTISSGGNNYDLLPGTKVRLVLTKNGYGAIYITSGRLVKFDVKDVAIYIDNNYIRTGHIDSIYIPSFDFFKTSLSYYMPPATSWTHYTENGYEVLDNLENHWIRVEGIGVNRNGLLSLIASENSTYLDGAAYKTVHDWIIE